MENLKLWQIINETWLRMAKQFEPVIEREARETGLNLRIWGLLLAVMTFEPEDTTPAHLMVRSPYTAAEIFLNRLKTAKELGLLDEVVPGKYRLTEKGDSETRRLIEIGRQKMMEMDKLSDRESAQLVGLFGRLIQNCLNSPPPPETWSIRHSCLLLPSEKPPMPYIEQAMSALTAYRDDAHLAAWRHTGLTATALETLTFFWNGEVSSLKTLCERLEKRGHSCRVYQSSIDELTARGLMHGPEDAPWITGAGRVFRNRVEDDTNRMFFSPWTCLDDNDKYRIAELLGLVSQKLTQETV